MVQTARERTSGGNVETRGSVSGNRRVLGVLLVQLSLGDILPMKNETINSVRHYSAVEQEFKGHIPECYE